MSLDFTDDWPPGTEERTNESVASVTLMSMERGTITRYLEPGDVIEAPTDRVEVRALTTDKANPKPKHLVPLDETDGDEN